MAVLASSPPDMPTVTRSSTGTTLATSAGMFRQGLQRVSWDGSVSELGTLCTATGPKGETVRCFLTTYPNGWDLHLERNNELVRTQAFNDADALLRMAETWQQELSS